MNKKKPVITAADVTLDPNDPVQQRMLDRLLIEWGVSDFADLPGDAVKESALGCAVHSAFITHMRYLFQTWENRGEFMRSCPAPETGLSLHLHPDGRWSSSPFCDPGDQTTAVDRPPKPQPTRAFPVIVADSEGVVHTATFSTEAERQAFIAGVRAITSNYDRPEGVVAAPPEDVAEDMDWLTTKDQHTVRGLLPNP